MEIKNIKEQYTKKINNKIQKNKELILESFIEFYGEEYRNIITDRFNNISFLYYINDITIFYIVDSLRNGYNEKFNDVIFCIPYLIYLIKNNLYKVDFDENNFIELGLNKIIGVSDEELLNNNELLKYCIGITIRKDNENPYQVNIPINNDIKRIIALPIFSVSDKLLFHEINHAICSELIIKNNKKIVKCGFDFSNEQKKDITEIVNDMTALEIYNIFKSKCHDTIFDDNIMEGQFNETYCNYFSLINDFYEDNKERIKQALLSNKNFNITDSELDLLNNLIKQKKK